MSDHARDGENANAALLVTLNPADFPDSSPLGGMYWQRQIEQAAFRAGGSDYRAPAQLVGDFLAKRPSQTLGTVQPTYRPGVTLCELHTVLPERITSVLEQALPQLDARLHGFARPDAVLTAPETRSSSPVRILRDAADSLTGEVRIIFQPAEEIGQGARPLIAAGMLDGAQRVFGLHTASDLPAGTVGVKPGANNAGVDHFIIRIHGKSAHVSTPQLGVDALYIAS